MVLVDVFCIVQGLIIEDYVQFPLHYPRRSCCECLPLFEPHVFNA